MTTLTEGRHAGEFIVSEANGDRSRNQATLVSGQDLAAGAVLGLITASGKYTAHDPVTPATDGSEVARAILLAPTDASGGDQRCVVVDLDAEVDGGALTWHATISGPQKAAGIAALLTHGIKVR